MRLAFPFQLQLGKKFVCSRVDPEEKDLSLRNGLELLLLARVAHKVQSSYCNGVPLHAQVDEKTFKVFFVDVGLVNAMSGFTLNDLAKLSEITQVNSGAIAEQFVAQMLRYQQPFYQDPLTHYWVREKSGSDAEVDFVIQKGLEIIPIEVKAGSIGKLKSLQIFAKEKKSALAIRLCSLPIQISVLNNELNSEGKACKLLTIPIYLAERLEHLVTISTK